MLGVKRIPTSIDMKNESLIQPLLLRKAQWQTVTLFGSRKFVSSTLNALKLLEATGPLASEIIESRVLLKQAMPLFFLSSSQCNLIKIGRSIWTLEKAEYAGVLVRLITRHVLYRKCQIKPNKEVEAEAACAELLVLPKLGISLQVLKAAQLRAMKHTLPTLNQISVQREKARLNRLKVFTSKRSPYLWPHWIRHNRIQRITNGSITIRGTSRFLHAIQTALQMLDDLPEGQLIRKHIKAIRESFHLPPTRIHVKPHGGVVQIYWREIRLSGPFALAGALAYEALYNLIYLRYPRYHWLRSLGIYPSQLKAKESDLECRRFQLKVLHELHAPANVIDLVENIIAMG